jgi:hypothetical protein
MYTRGSVLYPSTFYAVVGLVDNRDKVVKESAFVALSQPPQNGLGWANSLRVCVSTGAHKSSNCRGIKRTIDSKRAGSFQHTPLPRVFMRCAQHQPVELFEH